MKLNALSAQNSTFVEIGDVLVVTAGAVLAVVVTTAVVLLRPPQEIATNSTANIRDVLFISTVEFPGCTVLGILDLKTQCGEFIAYLVTGNPVLVCLGNGTLFQKHIHYLSESLLAAAASPFISFNSKYLKQECVKQ